MTLKSMFWTKRVVIGDGERGLVYRNRRFERLLAPGVYTFFDPLDRSVVTVHNLTQPEYVGDADVLIAQLGVDLSAHFVLADIGMQQVGLVSKNGKLEDVLAPGTRKLYWKGLVQVDVQTVSLADTLEVDAATVKRLRQLGLLAKVAVAVDVPVESAGLLFIDGKLVRTLDAGAYAFWNFQKNVFAEVTDLQKDAYMVALLSTLAGSVFLIAPTAYHRIRLRDRDKEALLMISNVFAIVGVVCLAIGMTAVVVLVTDLIFKAATTALVTAGTAALFATVWFVLPLLRKTAD